MIGWGLHDPGKETSHMGDKYTDAQLKQALLNAAELESVEIDIGLGTAYVVDYELLDLRRILSHLPDQQDEWEECSFEEICTGDQIKTRRRGVTSVYEHPVVSTYRSGPLGRRISLERGGLHPDSDTTFYRIPAPVQHPDPAQHPLIAYVAKDSCGRITRYASAVWDGEVYLAYSEGGYCVELHPESIIEWTPAGVATNDR